MPGDIIPGRFNNGFRTVAEIANYAQLYADQDHCFIIQKFGENQDVDSGVQEDVWSYGGTRPKPGDAELLDIVSSSANDTAAGTGARLVLVQGLDANYDRQEEYISMNGTTAVRTVNKYRHIHRMLSATVGSTEANQGSITATGVTSSNVMSNIPATYNITQMSHYMVPRGFTGYIQNATVASYKADGSGTRQSELSLWIQIPDFAEFRTEVYGVNSATIFVPYNSGIVVREKSLIWFEARAASNNTSVSAQYELLCIRNDWVRNP